MSTGTCNDTAQLPETKHKMCFVSLPLAKEMHIQVALIINNNSCLYMQAETYSKATDRSDRLTSEKLPDTAI